MASGNTTSSRGSPPCTIMCGLASNDYAPGRIFGCSLGASCACINLPLKGDLLMTGKSQLAQNMRSCFARVSLVAEPDYRKR